MTGSVLFGISRTFLWGVSAVLLVVSALIYVNSVSAPFVFDDLNTLVHRADVRAISLESFTSIPFRMRSVTRLSYALNYAVGGLSVAGYHVVNIGIHAVTGVLVFLLVLALGRRSLPPRSYVIGSYRLPGYFVVAAIAAAVFVVHPIQTNAVTSIAQRLASLASLFYVLTVLLYVIYRVRGNVWWNVGAVTAAIVGMHAKEIVFTVPFTVVAVEFFFFSKGWRGIVRRWKALVPYAIILPIVPLSLIGVLPGALYAGEEGGSTVSAQVSRAVSWDEDISRSEYLYSQFTVIPSYLRLVFVPVGYTIDHDHPVASSLFEGRVLAGLLFLIALAVWGVWLYRHNVLMSFGVLWFFMTLALESSIFVLPDVMHEYRMYLPMVGVAIVVAGAVEWVMARRETDSRYHAYVLTGIAGVVLVLGGLTVQRNAVWSNPVRLWEEAVAVSPSNVRAQLNLGKSYLEAGRYDAAETALGRAQDIQPSAVGFVNLGNVYAAQERYDSAIEQYEAAIAITDAIPEAYHSMGNAYLALGKLERAQESYVRALEFDARNVAVLNNVGLIYGRLGEMGRALDVYQQVVSIDPRNAIAFNNMGIVYRETGEPAKARAAFERALKIRPDYPAARENLQGLSGRD